MKNNHLLLLVEAFIFASFLADLASAQVNLGNITGVVRDSSGAAVPGAVIHLRNVGTGSVRTENTDPTGLYRFTLLDYGFYRLEAEHPGFKTVVRESIEVETGQTTTVGFIMQIGAVSESIQVTSASPLLRTETGSLGSTISNTMLSELPVIGRNPYVFLTLSPGIQYTTDVQNVHAWDNNGPSEFTSNGSSSVSEFLLDGIPNMRVDVVGFNPSPEAVEEMRVQTNAYDSEYGHTGAAFVNASTRSGTNQIHGNAYWYIRSEVLNANSFFNNLNGASKGVFTQNTYGGSLAGPVQIPKVYNGKNRLFYFFNFEGAHLRSTSYARAIVPTTLERDGDFSQTTDLKGRPYTIYDPATTVPSGSGYVRSPFPGNIIPSSRFDSVAVHTLAYYPLPNLARTSISNNNFQNPQLSGTDWSSVLGRGDYNLTDMKKLFVRYGWNSRLDPSTPFFGAGCCSVSGNPNGADVFRRGDITGAIGYTWIVSPRIVVDFRVGVTRYFDGDYIFGDNFNIAQLGFAPSFVSAVSHMEFPRFVMNDDLTSLGDNDEPDRTKIDQYNPSITIHTNIGRHALKYGFEYQIGQENLINPLRSTGKFTFDRTFTQGPDPTKAATNSGDDLASFLLGDVTSAYANISPAPALENKYFAGYIQDDWKVTNRLTLNLGLRLEHETALTDRFNHLNAGYNPSLPNPLAAQAEANYAAHPIPQVATLNVQGGMQFVGVNGAPRGAFNTADVMYAPRLGYALQLTNRIVWRGGFGLYYVPNNLSNYYTDGFSTQTNMVTSLNNNLTALNTLSNPFPNGLTPPSGAAGGVLTDFGHSTTEGVIPPGSTLPVFKNGMSEQISTGFQFVLPAHVSLETSYVGNVSQRLTISNNVDHYPNQYMALKTGLNAQVANPFYGVITDLTSGLSGPTVALSQLLLPFPQYTSLTEALLPFGRSNYNSLQVEVKKRTEKGLTFGGAYTFSKYMQATSYLNPNDAAPAHVISSSDHPHHVAVYGTYELPFGPGKPLLSTGNLVVKRLVGGWQVSWIGTLQSGSPLSFSGAERAYKSTANPNTIGEWFDVSQFTVHQTYTLTQLSSQVADLLSPGLVDWDITAMKAFSIKEGVKLTFKSEFYNAFNHPAFSAPNTTVTSSNFGRITGTASIPRQIQLALRLTF